jgi:outer membrane protein
MKKILFTTLLMMLGVLSMNAQKIALVDMEYILKKIPAYEIANEQLTQISKKWQSEVDVLTKQAKDMYVKYQTEMVYLSDELKKKRENDILAKEKEAAELKKNYFGTEGELFKKRQSLLTPIQDEIYTAVKALSEEKGYTLILDRATGDNIIFASPKMDISEEVLQKLGD